ncbi:MAG: hypothetical protein R2702_00095 [Acidimicrobiales bacterium]
MESEQEAHALVLGDGAHDAEVGEAPVDRREVELPVPAVEDRALGRVERGGEAVGHRVGDRDELAVERAELPALAVGHDDHLGAVHQARLLDAARGEAERQRRADDRERQLPQGEGQGPVVVLVAVGDDAPLDVVGPLEQPREVGQDQVDPEHVGVGEHQPAVEEHDAPLDLDRRAVPADLPEPAEEGDGDRRRHQSS